MPIDVDIHGSCVSRDCFNMIDKNEIDVKHYFSRNNIVSCMMPAAPITFSKGELVTYNSEYSERCMRYALNKNTINMLLASESEYLIIDFFDFCQPVAAFGNTTFSTYDYCFYNTQFYKNNSKKFSVLDFKDLPTFLWYGYVDFYFEKISNKFGRNIIINRLNCSKYYLSKGNEIKNVPERLTHFGNYIYNEMLKELEEYIISKYKMYIIDISKYFIPDEKYNSDTTPVHYEECYYRLQSTLIRNIISNKQFDELTTYSDLMSNLLDRQISDSDFKLLYNHRELPFNDTSYLDRLFMNIPSDELVYIRHWVALVYRIYSNLLLNYNSNQLLAIKHLINIPEIFIDDKYTVFSNLLVEYVNSIL